MDNPFKAYQVELHQSDRDPKTKSRYWQIVSAYQRWLGDRPPDGPTVKEFLSHLRDKGYAQKSLILYYTGLKLFLDFTGQPLKLKIRKPHTLPVYTDRASVERLITEAERGIPGQSPGKRKQNTAMILLMAFAGLRRGEVLSLRAGDVDFERKIITIRQGKGMKDRAVPMAARLVVPLREICAGKGSQDRLFKLTPRNCYKAVVNLARACGMDGFYPHRLRHWFGTQLAERGVNLKDIATLMGHSDVSTTAVYLDISANRLEEAVQRLETPGWPPSQTTSARRE